MDPKANEPWSSLEEVSTYLGVNKDTIRNWISEIRMLRKRKNKF